MVALLSTELQLLWAVTAGILLIILVTLAVAGLKGGGRGLTVVALVGSGVLILSCILLYRGFTIPKIPYDRVQLLVADIIVMVAAIIVGSTMAILVIKGGSRSFEP